MVEIISKLETFFGINDINLFFNQADRYDENKSKKKFLANHMNENNLRKWVLIPKEDIIKCKSCSMNNYIFKYERYIYISQMPTKDLSELIFGSIQEEKLSKCDFCNGREVRCIIESKIMDYPQVLIVVISKNVVNSFSLQNNIIFWNNEKSISYSLNHFIEDGTSSIYFICKDKIMYCQRYENNQFLNLENIFTKKPIVLFYYLRRNENNTHIISNNINIPQLQNVNMQNNSNININMVLNNNQGNNQINNSLNQEKQYQNMNIQNINNSINNQNMNMPNISNMNILNQNMNFQNNNNLNNLYCII